MAPDPAPCLGIRSWPLALTIPGGDESQCASRFASNKLPDLAFRCRLRDEASGFVGWPMRKLGSSRGLRFWLKVFEQWIQRAAADGGGDEQRQHQTADAN